MNCPQCGTPAIHVDTQTVKGVLADTLEILRPGNPYYYCKNPACAVVYFHESGDQIIEEDALRVSVYHKHPQDKDAQICYCFGIYVTELEQDIRQAEGQESIGRINAGIKAGQCACDIRNPQGSCCLGNVKTHVKEALAELA